MEGMERAQARLNNIQSVRPILTALRTISLGGWQAAQKQRTAVQHYQQHLLRLLPLLLAHLPTNPPAQQQTGSQPTHVVALVAGSERGLCGRFNAAVAEQAEAYLTEQTRAGAQVALMVLGSRLHRLFQRQQRAMAWFRPFPKTASLIARLAFDLTGRWARQYEAHEIDRVDLIYNTYRGVGSYQPTVVRLIPPPLPPQADTQEDALWPPPIIETDPLGLYLQIITQLTALALYGFLSESAAAEHATRYQLMEAAIQNTDRLIEELTIVVQTARRQAITQEMQSLASGANLLRS